MEHLEIYRKYEQPPTWALKEIQAGRLKGKSDINPQWRIEVLTETFGIVGFGWKYVITKQWIEKGGKDEIAAFTNIDLFIKVDSAWSDAIPGTGGSSFVASEKNGLYTSDECFKMSLTDAISVACKAIGIGSKIYNGSKYDKQPELESKQPETKTIDVKQAIELMKVQKTLEGVKKVWSDNKMLQTNKDFIAAKDLMKVAINLESDNQK
jgi:hypothetical protein